MANKSITEVMQEHRSGLDVQAAEQINQIDVVLMNGGNLHDTVDTQMTAREATRSNFEKDFRNTPEFLAAPAEHQKTIADVFAEADKANAEHEAKNEALSKPPLGLSRQAAPGPTEIAREAVGNINDGQTMQQAHLDKLQVEISRMPERRIIERTSLEANLRDKTDLGQDKTPIDQKGHDQAVQAEICKQVSSSEADGRKLSPADIAYKDLAQHRSQDGSHSPTFESRSGRYGKDGLTVSHSTSVHTEQDKNLQVKYNEAVKSMSPEARAEHNAYTAKMENHAKDMVRLDGKEAGVANNTDPRVSSHQLPSEIRDDAAKDLKQYENRLANNPNHQPSKLERAQMDLLAHKAAEKDPSQDSKAYMEQRAERTAQFNREYLKASPEQKVAFHKDREAVTGRKDTLLATNEKAICAAEAEKQCGKSPTGLNKAHKDAKIAEARYGENSPQAQAANKEYKDHLSASESWSGKLVNGLTTIAGENQVKDHAEYLAKYNAGVKAETDKIALANAAALPANAPAAGGAAAPNAVPPPAAPGNATPVNAAINTAAAATVNAAPVTPPPAAAPVAPAAVATTPPPGTATPTTAPVTPPPAAPVTGNTTPTPVTPTAPTAPTATATPAAPGNASSTATPLTRDEAFKETLSNASTSAVKGAVEAEKVKDAESGANLFGGQNADSKPPVTQQIAAHEAKIAELKASPEYKAENSGPESGKTLSGHDIPVGPGGAARGDSKPENSINESSYKGDSASSTSTAPDTDKTAAPQGLDGKGNTHSAAPEQDASGPATDKTAGTAPQEAAKVETGAPAGNDPGKEIESAQPKSYNELLAENEALKSENGALKQDNAELGGLAKNLTTENGVLLKDNTALEGKVESLTAENAEIKGVNQVQGTEIEGLKQVNQELSTANETVVGVAEELLNNNNGLSAKVESLGSENVELKEENGGLKNEIHEKDAEIESLKAQLDATKDHTGPDPTTDVAPAADAAPDSDNKSNEVEPTTATAATPDAAVTTASPGAESTAPGYVEQETVVAGDAPASTTPDATTTIQEPPAAEVSNADPTPDPQEVGVSEVSPTDSAPENSASTPEGSSIEPQPDNLSDGARNSSETPLPDGDSPKAEQEPPAIRSSQEIWNERMAAKEAKENGGKETEKVDPAKDATETVSTENITPGASNSTDAPLSGSESAQVDTEPAQRTSQEIWNERTAGKDDAGAKVTDEKEQQDDKEKAEEEVEEQISAGE